MKTIGIVAEGPRDYDLIAAVINTITNEENQCQRIQPEPNAAGQFGNGWKGVWKWCENNQGKLDTYMNSLTPRLDLLVVHMDGDVYRCEKEVHCGCQRSACDIPKNTHPLTCERIIEDRNSCPVQLPCDKHGNSPSEGANFLRSFLKSLLLPEGGLPVSYVIPFDATDAWIVAAFEQYEDYEVLHDPWRNIIARAPQYHEIKIKNRPNKSKVTYDALLLKVCERWNYIIEKCPQARQFDKDIRHFLMENDTNCKVIGETGFQSNSDARNFEQID